jgi:hypothetical protein
MDSTPLAPHGVLEHISESDALSTASTILQDVDEGALNSPTALSSDTDALSLALEGIPVGGELSLDMDSVSNTDAVRGSWADEVEPFAEPIGPVNATIERTESVSATPTIERTPTADNRAANVDIASDRIKWVEERVKSLERENAHLTDVLTRFELIMNQTMGRTDDALRDISVYQGKSRNVMNELKTQMAAVIHVVGKPAVQEAIKTTAEEAKNQPAFRSNSTMRGRHGGGDGDDHYQQQQPYSAPASRGSWQQRGGGGGGYRGNNGGGYRGRGGRGGGGRTNFDI